MNEKMFDVAVVHGELVEADKIIEQLPDEKCEFCGREKETRPYGPGGKEICLPCFDKLEIEQQKQGKMRFFGEME